MGVTSMFPQQGLPFPTPEPSCDGLTAHLDGRVLVAPFNDAKRAADLIAEHAAELGAVIVEPLQRCLPPEPGFLQALRDATSRHGVVLIFDEVVTGFRLALAGAQQYYGVTPDLVAYGKALGGGFPIGAFGGSSELMRLVCEDRAGADTYVWTASTLGGNPISATAALATLGVLKQPGVYERLHELGRNLRRDMRDLLDKHGIDARVLGDGPLAQIALTPEAPYDYRTSQHRDKGAARRLMLELFGGGVFLNPMGTKLYLSLAHDELVCESFLGVLDKALGKVFGQG